MCSGMREMKYGVGMGCMVQPKRRQMVRVSQCVTMCHGEPWLETFVIIGESCCTFIFAVLTSVPSENKLKH